MRIKLQIVNVLFFIISAFCFSQEVNIDSLKQLLRIEKTDTNKLFLYNDIAWQYTSIGSYDSSMHYANSSLKLAESVLANDHNKLTIRLTKKAMAAAYTNIGLAFDYQGNYPEALKNHLTALGIMEKLASKKGRAAAYINIGNIYSNQENYTDALENYSAALKIYEEVGSESGKANAYNNLGIVYAAQKNFTEALKNYQASLNIKVKDNYNRQGIAYTYNNIGLVYAELHNYKEAMKNFQASLIIEQEIGDVASVANSYNNMGDVFTRQKKYKQANECFLKAVGMSKGIGFKEILRDAYDGLAILNEETGNFKNAFEYHTLYIAYRDSMDNEQTREKTIQNQLNYEFEKKEAVANAEHQKELENQKLLSEEKHKKQNLVIVFVIGVLLLVVLFSVWVFKSLRTTQKQKGIIEEQKMIVEHQKHLVEENQKEIIDSITYAKRLQQAILPADVEVKKHLKESFILYKPKDIVAGDFYWLEASEINNCILVAAADSTGHGVPGAIISVVCSNALNRAVNEYNVTDTGKILDKTRELVLETFAKSDEEIKDGMDISLLSIDKKNRHIMWSGANNPLWYIHGNVMLEIKPNKQPIGQTDHSTPFLTHVISYNEGDVFYLITDGYADQFGGEKKKKFKHKQLKEKLVSIYHLPMEQQKEILISSFDQWKGELEQVDDVTIVGIKL